MLASLARTAAGSPWDLPVSIFVLVSWVAAFVACYVGMFRAMRMGIPAFFRTASEPIPKEGRDLARTRARNPLDTPTTSMVGVSRGVGGVGIVDRFAGVGANQKRDGS